MNVQLGIICEVFKKGRQMYTQMKAYVLPFQNNINFEFGEFLHTLKSVREHFALLQLAGVLSGNYKIFKEKKKYECTLGYNLWSFQEWPTNLYPNKSLRSPLSE